MEYIEISEIEWPQGTKLSIKALVRAAIAARIESKAPKSAAAALAKPPVESTMQHALFIDKSTPGGAHHARSKVAPRNPNI